MSTQHVAPAVTQPLTRRALREAERLSAAATSPSQWASAVVVHPAPSGPAAQAQRYPTRAELRRAASAGGDAKKVDPAAKFTGHAVSVPSPVVAAAQAVATDLVLLVPAEQAGPATVEVADGEALTVVADAERAEVADGATAALATVGAVDSSGRRWVPRVALLGALGAVTIVAPLSGVTGSGAAAAADGTPSPTPSPALAAAAPIVVDHLSAGAPAVQEASALAENPAAATRALTTASRSYQREALECPVESGANGTLGAVMGGEAPEQVVMPVADGSYRITSRYGYRTYPFAGMHEGADFAGALGTPLHAVADGVVTYVGGPRDGRTGTIVVIKSEIDGQDVEFWYGHQYSYGPRVVVGEEVVAGEVIGQIGNSGRSTGPHLHFEVHPGAGSETTDPLSWLQAHDAKPVSQAAACA